jgi:hypothetical protein
MVMVEDDLPSARSSVRSTVIPNAEGLGASSRGFRRKRKNAATAVIPPTATAMGTRGS